METGTTLDDVVDAFAELRAENSRLVASLAARQGLTINDIRAMHYIDGRPDCTPKHVADRLHMSTGAVTSLLDRLDRAGLVERLPNPGDRRSLLLRTTARGRDAVADDRRRYLDAWRAPLADADLDELRAALTTMAHALRAGQVGLAAGD